MLGCWCSGCRVEVQGVSRIHNMRIERWNGSLDGRVYSGASVTSVLGPAGAAVRPACAKRDFTWTEEDNRRVEELRAWWGRRHAPPPAHTALEEVAAGATVTLRCRVVAVHRASLGRVLRLEDGSTCRLRSGARCSGAVLGAVVRC